MYYKIMENINYEEYFSKDITDPNKLEELFDDLIKNKKNEEFLNKLLLNFPILPPTICKKYNVQKNKTEKELLFSIINDIIDKFGDKAKDLQKSSNENEILELKNYIDRILKKPAEDELKNLNIKKIPSRWNIIYNKIIRIDKETNDELIYYSLTNNLLNNIQNNKSPFKNILFLKEFMKIYNLFPSNYSFKNATKKFILLGLSNCEYIELSNQNFFAAFKYIFNLKDNSQSDNYVNNLILNPVHIYEGILHKSIIKFAESRLAESAFKRMFDLDEIPIEIKKEIFNKNIEKYICYFPYSSYNDIERTIKRFSLILINCNKNKKILNVENNILDDLLDKFSNIIVRKFTFGHEHQHLSGGLLFFSERINKLGTPPHTFNNGKLIYDYSSNDKGERGELFEILAYGKVFKVFTIFDLLFMANEKYDDLNIDSHLEEFKKYSARKKDLMNELKNFPDNQILSGLIKEIYRELEIIGQNSDIYFELSNKTIAYKNKDLIRSQNDYNLLQNAENIVKRNICPLSGYKENYRYIKNK